MKQSMFAIYDSKADAYLPPFIAVTVDVAKRMFAQAANDQNTDFYRFSGDYTLFELGSWDDNKGVITMHRTHISHGLAQHYIANDIARPIDEIHAVKGGE